MLDSNQKFSTYKSLVNAYIDSFLRQHQQDSSPSSLYEPIRYALEGNGKRIRPLLLLLCCDALGGPAEKNLPAAAAVELMHNFTLVHDDIMDRDETRRGRPTVHRKWTTDAAILAGDGLVVLAYKSLLQTDTPAIKQICQVFTDGIIEICEGQAIDGDFERDDGVTMNRYRDMIMKKTARLLSICSQIGAILAKGTPKQIRTMGSFAENLGLAFQIQDDLLDITKDQKTTGKDFGSDVKRRKRTFLYVHAMEHGAGEHREALRKIFRQPEIKITDILAARNIFEQSGAIAAAQSAIQGYLDRANVKLSSLAPGINTIDLSHLVQLILHRNA